MALLEILTIIFVILKLTGFIAWSWWLVFLPAIIAFTLYAIVITIQILMFVRLRKKVTKEFRNDDFFK